MLEKQVVIDKIEILEDGTIQTREKTRILEDGVVISEKSTNRSIIEPGEPTSKMDQRVRDIAAVVHTQEMVQAYIRKKAEREAIVAATGKER